MLSVERCRQLIPDSNVSNETIGKIREDFYRLANAILEGVSKESLIALNEKIVPKLRFVEESYEEYLAEERAAIHEFDGRCSRAEAERLAAEEYGRTIHDPWQINLR